MLDGKLKYIFLILTLFAILISDILTPLGVAMGMPYVMAVLITLWLPGKRITYWVTTISFLFTLLILLSLDHGAVDIWHILANRTLTLLTIFICMLFVLSRKNAESLLAQSESKNKLIIDSIPNAMLLINSQGKIEYANKIARKLFLYDELKKEIIDCPVEDLVPQEISDKHVGLRNAFISDPKPIVLGSARDVHGRKLNGNEFPIELGLNPINFHDEQYVLASVVDLTERRKIEQTLKDYTEKLKLSNDELTDFATIVAHDLKEPVRNIIHFSEFMLNEISSLEYKHRSRLEKINHLAKYTHRMMLDLLECAQLFNTKLEQEVVNLETLVHDIIKSITGKDNQIVVETLPSIKCDRIKMREVFRNLISNAIKHNDKAKCIIKIGCVNRDNEQILYVEDNGPGIAPDEQSSVFRMFSTGSNSKSQSQQSGIGLALVNKIIEKHSGQIWLESKEGQGSIFYFTIN